MQDIFTPHRNREKYRSLYDLYIRVSNAFKRIMGHSLTMEAGDIPRGVFDKDFHTLKCLLFGNQAKILTACEDIQADFPPQEVIPKYSGTDYLQRWYLKAPDPKELSPDPYNYKPTGMGVYFHRFLSGYEAEVPHSHPWYSLAIQLDGVLHEDVYTISKRIPDGDVYGVATDSSHGNHVRRTRRVVCPGDVSFRNLETIHSITAVEGNARTLFITQPWLQPWSFYPKENAYRPVVHTIWRRLMEGMELLEAAKPYNHFPGYGEDDDRPGDIGL